MTCQLVQRVPRCASEGVQGAPWCAREDVQGAPCPGRVSRGHLAVLRKVSRKHLAVPGRVSRRHLSVLGRRIRSLRSYAMVTCHLLFLLLQDQAHLQKDAAGGGAGAGDQVPSDGEGNAARQQWKEVGSPQSVLLSPAVSCFSSLASFQGEHGGLRFRHPDYLLRMRS